MDRRVVILSPVSGEDNALGESGENGYEPYLNTYAQKEDVNDSEKLRAGQTVGTLMSRFTVRSSSETRLIKTNFLIFYENKIWQILGHKESRKGRRFQYREITAISEID